MDIVWAIYLIIQNHKFHLTLPACLFPGCHRLKYSNFNHCGNMYDKQAQNVSLILTLSFNYNMRSVSYI